MLLEGTIMGTNRPSNLQGVHVYVQYGDSAPFLLAISDADGKIKMRLPRERTLKGKLQKLKKIFITARDTPKGPNTPKSFFRVYAIQK